MEQDPLVLIHACQALGQSLRALVVHQHTPSVEALIRGGHISDLTLVKTCDSPPFDFPGLLTEGKGVCVSLNRMILCMQPILEALGAHEKHNHLQLIDLGNVSDSMNESDRKLLWQKCYLALKRPGLVVVRRKSSDYVIAQEMASNDFHVLPIKDQTGMYLETIVATKVWKPPVRRGKVSRKENLCPL